MDVFGQWTRRGRERWQRQQREARRLQIEHGADKARALLLQRASDRALADRDRRHWQQVLKALKGL